MRSWASVLGSNLTMRNNKNVLEVLLEKDSKGYFTVSDSECATMMKKFGLDQSVLVEAVQICPGGRGIIYVTLKKEVDISKFCGHEVVEVSASGIRAVQAKPAVKGEVIITVKGLHPNTRDTVVFDYLSKFGKVNTDKVVYGFFQEGPLQGLKNGDRSYKLELKQGSNLGSYHYIDNQKVTMRYIGQQQTCARCFKNPRNCKGRGVAKRCEAEGGMKTEFVDYILDLWKTIGYTPENQDLEIHNNEADLEESPLIQVGGLFSGQNNHLNILNQLQVFQLNNFLQIWMMHI